MKYAMFIHYKPGYHEAVSEDEQEAVVADHGALAQDPHARSSAQLQPIETATTLRGQSGNW
ncbi:hypothetical protein E0H75_13310 [Kribbella capetownensis]|uniref:YCII-related domain-containing protein n=1 Tax=Kribbella capetownensis TaxID=1572659 RepID=A0A4R0K0D9_9ACTN|nr:hypothetical protein [Kribbella capetownensis]TCC51108.1 hypothetical protein E0H75_13310 [Kribbella capetownensis]